MLEGVGFSAFFAFAGGGVLAAGFDLLADFFLASSAFAFRPAAFSDRAGN
jgi:hypothetical protein